MSRKSLQFKLKEVAKKGTLRTYSRDEAITYYMIAWADDKELANDFIKKANNAYDRNLILCHYKTYPEYSDEQAITEVLQLTPSLADFVLNIAFPILN